MKTNIYYKEGYSWGKDDLQSGAPYDETYGFDIKWGDIPSSLKKRKMFDEYQEGYYCGYYNE